MTKAEIIGGNVRYYREKVGTLSQGRLGMFALGMTESAGQSKIKRIENGTYEPKYSELVSITRVLGVKPSALEDDDPKPLLFNRRGRPVAKKSRKISRVK